MARGYRDGVRGQLVPLAFIDEDLALFWSECRCLNWGSRNGRNDQKAKADEIRMTPRTHNGLLRAAPAVPPAEHDSAARD